MIAKYRDTQRFSGNRELAILRDGEKCVRCGMTRAEHISKHGRDITVDHKDNKGRYMPKKQRDDSLDNLQTLCMFCHGWKDNQVKKLTDNQVINIRHMKGEVTHTELARLYGVSIMLISYIQRGLWRKNPIPDSPIKDRGKG